MRFKKAVQETSGLENAFHPGLQALPEADRKRITCQKPARLAGSVYLDKELEGSFPNDPRWDFGVGVEETDKADRVVWVEIHPASSNHVQSVLDKQTWLKKWLNDSASLLKQMPRQFVWVASGKVSLQANSPQRKKLAKAGIHFSGRNLKL